MNEPIVIGSRGSELALWQTHFVSEQLKLLHEAQTQVRVIQTRGDKNLADPLYKTFDKGQFTKELEDALLAGDIRLAVHSLKDLPTMLPDGLALGAILYREFPQDGLIGEDHAGLDDLPEGGMVLCGSLRRKAQLLERRPDLKIRPVRGNVPTRLRKRIEQQADGLILAVAGLERIKSAHHITEVLDPREFIPACGQGAMAVEIRADDDGIRELLASLHDVPTHLAVTAERTVLAALGGGCHVPIGAYGEFQNGEMALHGMVGLSDGSRILRATCRATVGDLPAAEALGRSLADSLRQRGAEDILNQERTLQAEDEAAS